MSKGSAQRDCDQDVFGSEFERIFKQGEHLPDDIAVEADPQCVVEFKLINTMMDAAVDNNLLTEVIWSYGQGMNSNDGSVEDAVQFALNEWDI